MLLEAQSSGFVMWRFMQPKERHYQDEGDAKKFKADRDARREREASNSVAILFMACSGIMVLSAVYKIATYNKLDKANASSGLIAAKFEEVYSWPVGLTFFIIAWLKWALSCELRSELLQLDALASFMGAFMALIVGVAGLAEDRDGAWMADPLAALFCASVLMYTGFRTWQDTRYASYSQQRFEDISCGI